MTKRSNKKRTRQQNVKHDKNLITGSDPNEFLSKNPKWRLRKINACKDDWHIYKNMESNPDVIFDIRRCKIIEKR